MTTGVKYIDVMDEVVIIRCRLFSLEKVVVFVCKEVTLSRGRFPCLLNTEL
jgi:hypothetical protein